MRNQKLITLLVFLCTVMCCSFLFSTQVALATGIADTLAPSIPVNLSTSSVDLTSITLTWSPSTDNVAVKGYQIFRDGVKIGTSSSPSYTSKNLTPGKTYVFTVKAYDAANNLSAESLSFSVTTLADVDAPTIPVNLITSSTSTRSISIKWDASTDNVSVKGYQIFRDGSKISTTCSCNYTNTGLMPGMSYVYTIKAYDAFNNLSEASVPFTFTTDADIQNPTIPADLSASSITALSISLSWTPSTDDSAVKGYEISRDGVKISTTSGTSYKNSGLFPGTNYTYVIRAYDITGKYSDGCNPILVTTTPDIENPTVPANVTASLLTCTGVTLSWDASTDDVSVKGYQIFRNNVKVGSTCSTSFTNSGLLPLTQYSYSIKAYDTVGKLSDDGPLDISTSADTEAPSVPANLVAKTVTGTTVTLAWNASTDNTGIKGYDIFKDGVKISTTKSLSYKDSGLIPGNTYNYSVASIDLGDNSSGQSSVIVITNGAPSAPTNLKASSKTDSSLKLSWTASKDTSLVQGYEIYRDGLLIGSVTGTSFTDSGLTGNTTYLYTAKSYNALHQLSDESSPLSTTTSLLINGEVTWSAENGPYILNGGLIIAQNACLQILPGVQVKINPGESIAINGSLNAYGSDEENIIFTSTKDSAYGGTGVSNPSDYWETINIAATGEFTADRIKIVYGNNLMNVQGSLSMMNSEVAYANTSGITVTASGQFNGTNLKIHDCCHVEACKGIYTLGAVNLSNSEIYNCPGTGVLIGSSGQFNANSTNIHNCGKGIEIEGTLNLVVSEISNCDYGLYFDTTNINQVTVNSFVKNNLYAVYNNKPTVTIDMSGNYWGSPNGPSVFNETTQTWEGDGDKVSPGVVYTDWLQDPIQ